MVEHLENLLEEIRLIQRQLSYLLSDLEHIQSFQKDIIFYEDQMKVSLDNVKEHHLLLQVRLFDIFRAFKRR